jgi:predicted nucleic acid-binding Zn ribbon protein
MAERIGELIKQYLKDTGLKKKISLTEFEQLWGKATNPVISKNSRPKGFSKGVLTVEVDSSIVLQELTLVGNQQIIARLNRLSPKKKIYKLKYELSQNILM